MFTNSIPPRALSPSPTSTRSYPWKFALGDEIYALGHAATTTLKVVGGELWMTFPHIHAIDACGKTWIIPQIHCSSKPIIPRKA
jgi:hypothetical protein